LDYVLEPFFNECSPWNVDCEDGITCTECTYNSNGHTTPVYKITWQVIYRSTTPLAIGIEERQADAPRLELYPNPVTGILQIKVSVNEEMQCTVTDLKGRILKEFTINAYEQLDVSDLSEGMYLLRLKNDGNYITDKFIVENEE
jgi:hypothetical protein